MVRINANLLILVKKTIGIANEFADSFYLEMCDKVFIVKGDARLMSLAEKRKWEII